MGFDLCNSMSRSHVELRAVMIVTVDQNGCMGFDPRNSMSRSHVELRAEMNVLVILNTCQHPLDPNPKYDPKPVGLSLRRVDLPGPLDACRVSRPENDREF